MGNILTFDGEQGTLTNTPSSSDLGNEDQWTSVSLSGANCTAVYDDTRAFSGDQSFKLEQTNTTGAIISFGKTYGATPSVAFSLFFYLTANPSSNWQPFRWNDNTTLAGNVQISSAGRVICRDSGAGSATSTVAQTIGLNQWNRLDVYTLHSATVGVVEAKLYKTTPNGTSPDFTVTLSSANTLTQSDRIVIGNAAQFVFGPYWIDAIRIRTGSPTHLGPWGAQPRGMFAR